MIDQEICDRVFSVLRKNRRVGSAPLGIETTFDEFNLDSLDIVSIVFDLEEEFGITIPEQPIANLRRIGDIVEGIRRVLDGGAGTSAVEARAS